MIRMSITTARLVLPHSVMQWDGLPITSFGTGLSSGRSTFLSSVNINWRALVWAVLEGLLSGNQLPSQTLLFRYV
jgi:hypothetical protein